MTGSRQSFDHRDDLLSVVTVCPREVHQLCDACQDDRLVEGTTYANPAPSRQFEQTLVTQNMESTDDRVLVDVQDLCEIDRRGKPLAGANLAFGDRSTNLRDHLIVEQH